MDAHRTSTVWPVTSPLGGALFVPVDGGFCATGYSRGPWSPDSLHGGPVVGLLGYLAERAVTATTRPTPTVPDSTVPYPAVPDPAVPDPAAPTTTMLCTRLTAEIHRPVPLAPLQAHASIVKPGRRSMIVDTALLHDGAVIARATSHWAKFDESARPMPPGADGGPDLSALVPPRGDAVAHPRSTTEFDYPDPGFNCDASELRYTEGSHEESGPGTSWVRLASPLIDGVNNSAFTMVATVSDLAAAAGWESTPTGGTYINPDLTLQLARLPIGDWIALDAHVVHGTGDGVAMMTARVFDDHGPIGHITQSLMEIA